MPSTMEGSDEVQVSIGRLHRPESSASSHSRCTPQSSNNSTSNLQYRRQSGMAERERLQDRTLGSQRESPGASLLQEKLKEMKVARLGERHQSADMEVLSNESGARSTPQIKAVSRLDRDRDGRPSSSGARPLPLGKKGMGLKEMEEQVSTLHKQNFDLKLELFHRRQRQSELEERLEAAEAQIAEQAEMQKINEQLLAELEKRDQAVEEAVGIICALEEKVDKLGKEQTLVRSYDAQHESDYFQQNHDMYGEGTQDPGSSPPQHNRSRYTTSNMPAGLSGVPKAVPRMPSFLSEPSEGAEALRSLYLPADQSQSLLSLPKLSEDNNGRDETEEVDGMNSPRLSVLSESSFLSVYGDKNLEVEALAVDHGTDRESPGHQEHRKSLSIEKWVQERAKAANSSSSRLSVPKVPAPRNTLPSILDILESPLQRLEKMERKLSRQNASARLLSLPGGNRHGKQIERDTVRKTEMTTFGHQQGLPPTPDTIGTDTLRRFKISNDSLERGATEEDRLYRISDAPSNSALNVRPHSAGETVTSRREGHGWDTVTQSEFTETNSDLDLEIPSTYDPWIAMGREKRRPRVQPPDMFTFGVDDEWGRDMMFNRDNSRQLPRPKDYSYGRGRSGDPRSEDTVTATSHTGGSSSTSTQGSIPNSGLSNQSSPEPPERRSSLAHSPAGQEKKQPKPPMTAQTSLLYRKAAQATTTTAVYTDQTQNSPKRSRITSKIFNIGRLDLPPSSSSGTAKASNAVASNPSTTRSYSDYASQPHGKHSSIDLGVGMDGLHSSSATPPPISRYPRSKASGEPGEHSRPLSASSLDSNIPHRTGKSVNVSGLRQQRRRAYDDGFGVDGANEERPRLVSVGVGAFVNAKGDGNGKAQGGRRGWFGLGRTASLRR